jgi:hypothetical protein
MAKRPDPVLFKPETTVERKARLDRDIPKARAEHEARQRAVDARTVKLRALRLAKEAADAAAPKAPKAAKTPKKKAI